MLAFAIHITHVTFVDTFKVQGQDWNSKLQAWAELVLALTKTKEMDIAEETKTISLGKVTQIGDGLC